MMSGSNRPNKPDFQELNALNQWGADGHYAKHMAMYILQAKAYVNNVMLSIPNTTLSGDELVSLMHVWLKNYSFWVIYLSKKPHITRKEIVEVTEIMAKYIAWDAYSAIIIP